MTTLPQPDFHYLLLAHHPPPYTQLSLLASPSVPVLCPLYCLLRPILKLVQCLSSKMFVPHPTLEGYWKFHGRVDDQIVHSAGEKVTLILYVKFTN